MFVIKYTFGRMNLPWQSQSKRAQKTMTWRALKTFEKAIPVKYHETHDHTVVIRLTLRFTKEKIMCSM